MKVKYDPKVDAVYIELSKGKYDRTRKVSSSVMVDEDVKGRILGIEVLDAKKNLSSFDPKKPEFKFQTL